MGHGLLITKFLDHTQRHTTVGTTPLDEWSSRHRDLYLKHTTPTTDIHAAGGIRTHNLSSRAAADLHLRPRGHWDRHSSTIKKVKWSRYRPGVVQRVGRGIALLFHDRGTRRGWVVSSTPRPQFTPGERLITHCTGGWVGPRVGLDGRKISSPPGSIPDRPARSSVAIPTELPWSFDNNTSKTKVSIHWTLHSQANNTWRRTSTIPFDYFAWRLKKRAISLKIATLRDVVASSVVARYQRFGLKCCLHLQYYLLCLEDGKQHIPHKHCQKSTKLHGVTHHKTAVSIVTTFRIPSRI